MIMAVSMTVGSYLGAQFALQKGVRYVKGLFILVTTVFILKNLYDYLIKVFHH